MPSTAAMATGPSTASGVPNECGSLRGRAATPVTLRNGNPPVSGLDWQSSRLPTDYVGMAKVSLHARGVRPCRRQKSAALSLPIEVQKRW